MQDVAKIVKRRLNEVEWTTSRTDRIEMPTKEDIREITWNDFNDPKRNNTFSWISSIVQKGNQIGFKARITDDDTDETKDFYILSDTLGKSFEKLEIANQSGIGEMTKHFFTIKVDNVVRSIYKRWQILAYYDNDAYADELEDEINDFKQVTFNAENVDEMIRGIQRLH